MTIPSNTILDLFTHEIVFVMSSEYHVYIEVLIGSRLLPLPLACHEMEKYLSGFRFDSRKWRLGNFTSYDFKVTLLR